MPFFYLPDRYYILLVIPAMLIALWAQMRVKSTFAKYSREGTYGGLTGAQAARRILDANGLTDVRIEPVRGSLTDHYDPRDKVVRLSMDVYGCDTVAAVGVAAHETGHAIQHAVGYFPLQLRNAIIPIITIMGPNVASILTGTFVVESIFAIPGMGKYYVDSINANDYTMILGMTVFYGAFLILASMIVDILYGVADPRIRVGRKTEA